MNLCDYGCGQEAKFPPRKGQRKWCCESHWSRCPVKRKENSMRKKEEWKDTDSGYNSILWKEKQSKSHKLTIEQIKEKYPFFLDIEELRYNPDKPGEKEIQVHCKNSNCLNSKEKNGWFTPTYTQIHERRSQLEKQDGNDGSFIYCSQYCKDTCPCYNIINDPLQLAEYQQYQKKVQKFTHLTLKYNSNKILNIELRGRKYGYDLDHKFSIKDGFNNDIDPKIIGHWKNLEVVKALDNRVKSRNSSISIEEIQKI